MARKKRVYPVKPIAVVGDIAHVPLTKGYVAIIDAADAEFVGRWNWTAHVHKSGRVTAFRKEGTRTIEMHRALLDPPQHLYVDHINRNAVDNRRCNLRLATHAENIRNQRPRPNRALPKGIQRDTRGSAERFHARICVNYRQILLGSFKTLEEAIEARLRAEREFFGEFAPSA
jgi:hypothetical protein